jgi:zinc transport system substrate-binding protein
LEGQILRKVFPLLALVLICVILSSCSSQSKQHKTITKDNKLNIYTTVFAFQSFTQQIGGKYVHAQSIYPPGVDTHSYEPTQRNMIDIAKSDLFIYTSDDLDPVAHKIASSIRNKGVKLPVAQGLNHSDLLPGDEDDEHEESHDAHHHAGESNDPHVWLDPVLDQQFALKIKNKLVQKDPQHKTYYEHNYRQLKNDLKGIDQQLSNVTKDPKRKTIVISHDSLGYLAQRYHFKQVGVTGMNNEDPSQQEIMSIIHNIKQTRQPYVLYEQNISSKLTDIIKKETQTKPLSFNNLATRNKDDNNNVKYQTIMQHNIETLDTALNK